VVSSTAVAQPPRRLLPRGQTLPEEQWRARHRGILVLLAVQALLIPVYALAEGYALGHSLVEAAPPALLAVLAWRAARYNRRVAASIAAIGLLTCSALAVHLSGGVIEAHFHFFVMIVVLSLYEDWLVFVLAVGFVLVHHAFGGAIASQSIFDHGDATAHPRKWALIHGAFVAAAGAASIAAWRFNEEVRAAQREAEERYRSVVATLSEGVVVLAPDRTVRTCNASAERILGVDLDGLRELELFDGASDLPRKDLEAEVTRGDGRRIWISMNSNPLALEAGGWSSVWSFSDITERKQFDERLRHLADHDPLTDLVNRRRFGEELEREVESARRYGTGGALLVIDLDRFKRVNDNFGHPAGDDLIVRVAEILRGRLRTSDVVGRLGGDEFAITLPHLDEEEARVVADDLLELLRDQTGDMFPELASTPTASIGIAPFPEPHESTTAAELLVDADIAMYEAKRSGRDRVGLLRAGDQGTPRLFGRARRLSPQ
jgi:diguanylate cyclase (GGDEF)-like protein